MKILAIDVGAGTQDIMFYDSKNTIENSVKLVMPSPTKIFAKRIKKCKNDLLISGETMGGGPINKAIQKHLTEGYRVVMTENAAKTVRDNLDHVKSKGIEIISSKEENKYSNFEKIELIDVNLESIRKSLSQFDVEPDFDYIGIAVQDHGYMEGMGDRNFRFMKIKEVMDKPKYPEEFAFFNNAPDYFTRINAVFRTFKGYKTTVMDSKFASISGATCDQQVKKLERYIVMDIGNGHTLAAAINKGKIYGVFEHHTSSLTPEKIENYVNKLVDGTITHEEVHSDHGHGAWSLSPIGEFEAIVATGPRRKIMEKTDFNVHYAAPAGDVMMTGPVGLIKAIQSNI
ncbi:MAG: DUF1786 domain-containing protein [Methanobacterium sp.]|uniref:DUF1786 domain-containing protein n=1 Tax=Methanobacterium sp. TaxID=2164 RepID=UPI003D65A930|nr:DUF1786 domain-containing protein [Methanobacterium sp.]